ncbi:LLM class flavin-dependent oxidoreductase [Kribbella pittospori]|nr:TIGR03619 family F420-dependent LLM class oxidoreductase [Kribbella pittospori]
MSTPSETDSLTFGVQLPTGLAGAGRAASYSWVDRVIRVAVEAERLGFHEVGCSDHFSSTHVVREKWENPPEYFEPLVTLTAVAARTSVVRLAAGALVLPLREPVLLAKQVATLDRLSDGRTTLAVGVGPHRDEFECVLPSLKGARRSRLTRESIQCLRGLFTERLTSFSGNYRHFRNVECYPKPVQTPLPIYSSGNDDGAIRRAGELCDGWLADRIGPDDLRNGRKKVLEYADRARRDPDTIHTSLRSIVALGTTAMQARERFGRSALVRSPHVAGPDPYLDGNLVGTPDQVCAQLEAFAEAGLDHFSASFVGNTVDELLDQLQVFADQVLPAFAERVDRTA